MKIIAVNGSHRKGKNTAFLLQTILAEAEKNGAQTELLELVDYNIQYCKSCNKCLGQSKCSITGDDMDEIAEKLLAADGIVLGSPVYWSNVSALMKNFMDRTRWMHMVKNLLAGKVGAAVTNAGLRNGGQDLTLQVMHNFLVSQGLYVVDAREQDAPLILAQVAGSLQEGVKEGKSLWRRSVQEDEAAIQACKQLGRNMVKMIKAISA